MTPGGCSKSVKRCWSDARDAKLLADLVRTDRSGVSQAIVPEIQRNTVQHRRSDRTLEALSAALQWHPQHLFALLHNRRSPAVGEPREDITDPVTARLAVIEDRLTEITEDLAALRANVA